MTENGKGFTEKTTKNGQISALRTFKIHRSMNAYSAHKDTMVFRARSACACIYATGSRDEEKLISQRNKLAYTANTGFWMKIISFEIMLPCLRERFERILTTNKKTNIFHKLIITMGVTWKWRERVRARKGG